MIDSIMSSHLLTWTLIEVVYRLKESVCFLKPAKICCSHWNILWHKKKEVLLTEDTKILLHRNLSGRKSWKLYNGLKNSAKQHFKQKFNTKDKAPPFWNITQSFFEILLSHTRCFCLCLHLVNEFALGESTNFLHSIKIKLKKFR